MRLLLRRIVRSVSVAAPAALLCACGGKIYGDDCIVSQPAAPSCSGVPSAEWQVTVSGDTSKCGFAVQSSADAATYLDSATCAKLCGFAPGAHTNAVQCTASGDVVTCTQACMFTGRPYEGLSLDGAPNGDTLGGFFAQMAYFEAASVDAFAILDRELLENGAPRSLRRSARAARRDEIRHARMAETVARRLGTEAPRPPRATRRARSIEAIARENATEGCVAETYAAAVAVWQSERAATPALRAYFDRIARDEARHAALARRVDAWIMQRLTPTARRRVSAAREAAWERLAASPPRSGAAVAGALGLPSEEQAKRLAAALADALT